MQKAACSPLGAERRASNVLRHRCNSARPAHLATLARKKIRPDDGLQLLTKETVMEGRIFDFLCNHIRTLGKTRSFKGKRFSDATIVITHLWAVLWDRPISWACRLENWPEDLQW